MNIILSSRVVGSYQLLNQAPTNVEVKLGCDNEVKLTTNVEVKVGCDNEAASCNFQLSLNAQLQI